jgi:PHD/YefM family antitoxin component YafN of YafNO toxin-antitoxin module
MNTQFVVDESGRKTAVILPVEEYDELLEDIHDLAVIAERGSVK